MVRLTYEGVDITGDVSIACAWHDMYAEGHADELLLKCADTRSLWDVWGPKHGDRIVVSDGVATTGLMYVESVEPQSSLISIRAFSVPMEATRERRWKSWEEVRLLQLAAEICNRYGLSYETYGVTDRLYSYVDQGGDPDLQFLAKRCALEGAAFLVFDGKLVIYDCLWMDSQEPQGTLSIVPGQDYRFDADEDGRYGICKVGDGSTWGTFTADAEGKTYTKVIADPISNQAEADRFARGLLRHVNKRTRSLEVRTDTLMRQYAAGSLATIQAPAAASWDGKALIHHIRHDYVRRRSTFGAWQAITDY